MCSMIAKKLLEKALREKVERLGYPVLEVLDLPEGFEMVIQYPDDEYRAWHVQSIGYAIDSLIKEERELFGLWRHIPWAKGGIFRAKIERMET